jgi:hypothetical protein
MAEHGAAKVLLQVRFAMSMCLVSSAHATVHDELASATCVTVVFTVRSSASNALREGSCAAHARREVGSGSYQQVCCLGA